MDYKTTQKMLILHDEIFSFDEFDDVIEKVGQMGGEARIGHARAVITSGPDVADEIEKMVRLEFPDLEKTVSIDLPDPSGKKLSVDFILDGEIISAGVDERLWFVLTEGPQKISPEEALIAIYEGLDIEYMHPDGISVTDTIVDRQFWNPQDMEWDPASWDEDELMAEISFTPQADLAGNQGLVDVDLPGLNTSIVTWEVPVRLIENVDLDQPDDLAFLPVAPEEVRKWASVAPFRVTVEMPEPESEPGL